MAGTRFVPAAAAQLPHRNTRRTLRVWGARIRGSRALPAVARERDEDRDARRAALAAHFRSSGAISLGRIRGMSGQTMIAASMRSIGTSMIIVSLSANLT